MLDRAHSSEIPPGLLVEGYRDGTKSVAVHTVLLSAMCRAARLDVPLLNFGLAWIQSFLSSSHSSWEGSICSL